MFDHQIVSLPSEPYQAVNSFFKSDANKALTGTRWKEDPSGVKGFAFFEDGSYIEIWDESRLAPYGYQDACRLPDKESVHAIAKDYGAQLGDFPNFTVAGRKGWAGDSKGGVFFIWHEGPPRDSTKAGVRKILKLVPSSSSGTINAELVDEYQRAGLRLEFLDNDHILVATDNFGVRRIAVASHEIQGNGFIALKFSRHGAETQKIPIYSEHGGKEQIFMQLEPLGGTLVFRSDLYGAEEAIGSAALSPGGF